MLTQNHLKVILAKRILSNYIHIINCIYQGEICIGGPVVTAGYFKMPDKTAEDYFEEGGIQYFRTGDVGQWEKDGALRIIDRKKGQLIRYYKFSSSFYSHY